MKNILLCLFGSLLSISIYAQCDAPIVESWSDPSVDNITVNFTPPPGAESYTLEITGEYGFGVEWEGLYTSTEPLVLTGSISSGVNTVNFDATGVLSPDSLLQFYYYSASLSVVCANGDTSAINHFYVSEFSLLNDPGYDTGDLFSTPLTPIFFGASDTGESIESYISVPAGQSPEGIDSISVFVDLGKSTNIGLSIDLISPQGTTIQLLQWYSQLGNSHGFSVIFKDGYPLISDSGFVGPRGIYAPYELLSPLNGENPAGVWTVRIINTVDGFDGILFGVGLTIHSSPCLSSLSGKAFYDLNSNMIQDDEEPGLSNSIIYNAQDDQDIFSYSNGHYTDCTSPGSGTLSLSNTPDYYTTNDISFTVSDGEILADLDFPLQPIAGNEDLKVDLYSLFPDRPGFENRYVVHYQNVGTECIDNVDIHLNLDSLLLITYSSNNNVSFSGNTADLNIAELCPLDNGYFTVYTMLSDTVSTGTELTSLATISPVANDQNSTDNVAEYNSVVVSSFDPNDKTVSTSMINPSFVSSGESLKYMVRFQNTGNYLAERVLIVDTLDANLDPNSFVVSSSSHDVNVTRNGNIFYFDFENIFLPDSATDEIESHGYIRYQIKPNVGIADGVEIKNTASIFFDFNPPIVTNTVSTAMDFASGVTEQTFEARVYPNPARNQINLEWLPNVRVEQVNLLDVTGKKIQSYTVSGTRRIEIGVEKLPAGAYIFQFIGADLIKPVVWMKN